MINSVIYYRLIDDYGATNLVGIDMNNYSFDVPRDKGYIHDGWYSKTELNKVDKELTKRDKLKFSPDIIDEKKIGRYKKYRVLNNYQLVIIKHPEYIEGQEYELKDIILSNLKVDAFKQLRNTDWTQVADEPISQDLRKEYREYRRYLRNIDRLWINEQLKEPRVLPFKEWKIYKPKFEYSNSAWYLEELDD